MMNNPTFELQGKIFNVVIIGLVFLMISFFAITPASFASYKSECLQEGCSRQEVYELYNSYANECLSEGCSNEEMYETAGHQNDVCTMFLRFRREGYTVSGNSLRQFGC